jgi:hypothetical protein
MESLSTTVQITSTSLTNIQNQQYTSSSVFEHSGFDLYTQSVTNTSYQLSTINVETVTSKNSSYSEVTSASSTINNGQMATSSSINTTNNDIVTSIGVSVAPIMKLFLSFFKSFLIQINTLVLIILSPQK